MTVFLFLGLDGLDAKCVATFADVMPVLAPLFSAHGTPVDTPRGMPHRFWSTFHAAAGLGSAAVDARPFWHGDHALVIDVPDMPIARTARAQQIRGWGWDDVPALDFATMPDSLAQEVHALVGLPRPARTDHSHAQDDNARVLTESLVERIAWKERLGHRMLAREAQRVDLGFSEARTIVRALGPSAHRTHVRSVYAALDAAVGRLMASSSKTAVLAGPCMAMAHDNNRFLPEIAHALSRTSTAGHRSIHYRVARARGLLNRSTARRCWALPNTDAFGAIRISVAGRDLAGRIRPGNELADVSAQFQEALQQLRNADDNTAAVAQVLATDAYYQGPHRDDLPDLLVQWRSQPNAGLTCDWLRPLRWPSTRVALGAPREGATLVTSWERPHERLRVEQIGALLQYATG